MPAAGDRTQARPGGSKRERQIAARLPDPIPVPVEEPRQRPADVADDPQVVPAVRIPVANDGEVAGLTERERGVSGVEGVIPVEVEREQAVVEHADVIHAVAVI